MKPRFFSRRQRHHRFIVVQYKGHSSFLPSYPGRKNGIHQPIGRNTDAIITISTYQWHDGLNILSGGRWSLIELGTLNAKNPGSCLFSGAEASYIDTEGHCFPKMIFAQRRLEIITVYCTVQDWKIKYLRFLPAGKPAPRIV